MQQIFEWNDPISLETKNPQTITNGCSMVRNLDPLIYPLSFTQMSYPLIFLCYALQVLRTKQSSKYKS